MSIFTYTYSYDSVCFLQCVYAPTNWLIPEIRRVVNAGYNNNSSFNSKHVLRTQQAESMQKRIEAKDLPVCQVEGPGEVQRLQLSI